MAAELKPTNGYDLKKLDGYFNRMETIEDECSSIMGRAMQECKSLRDDQKDIKQEAKDAGIRPKVFAKLWKARKALRKSEADLEALEDDDREQIEAIVEHAMSDKSFGDTPFGAHLLCVYRPG